MDYLYSLTFKSGLLIGPTSLIILKSDHYRKQKDAERKANMERNMVIVANGALCSLW